MSTETKEKKIELKEYRVFERAIISRRYMVEAVHAEAAKDLVEEGEQEPTNDYDELESYVAFTIEQGTGIETEFKQALDYAAIARAIVNEPTGLEIVKFLRILGQECLKEGERLRAEKTAGARAYVKTNNLLMQARSILQSR